MKKGIAYSALHMFLCAYTSYGIFRLLDISWNQALGIYFIIHGLTLMYGFFKFYLREED